MRAYKNRWTALLSAGIALLVAGAVPLVWVVGVGALMEPSGAAHGDLDTNEGRQQFQARCAVCHAVNPGESALLGPNLAQIGRSGATRRPPLSAPAYILESIIEPDAYRAPGANGVMPANLVQDLSEASIRNLVAYVALLGATPDMSEIASLPIRREKPVRVEEAPEFRYDRMTARRGRELFEGKGRCVHCHAFERTPARVLVAPKLAPVYGSVIREAITRSDHILNPAYQRYSIQTDTGTAIQGRIIKRGRDALRVLRMDDTGKMEPLDVVLAEIARHADGAPMIDPAPLSLVDRYALSEDEIDALVTFVQLSKAEGEH